MDAPTRIAFLGTYPPRRCGIATFTRDLATGMLAADDSVKPLVVAVTDEGLQYDYAPDVEYEIRQGTKSNYARAAELVNYKAVRWVSLQHEYGIFGGDDGAYILDFLGALRVPAAVTLHTVLDTPSPTQRAIVQKMAKAAVLVVMSQVAADLLARRYELQGARVEIIPHGIPDMSPRDQEGLKARFGVAGQRMLLTFGLLGPNKGVETVIRALPALVAAHPDLVYFVVGATHPAVLRQNGEAYRTSLERLAEQLGVREHVVFRDQYVTTEELCSYLQAADVFVSPYLNEAQVTSGALSYAMGAGSAVVSTPYWHAKELLAEGRGRLFPFGDSIGLANTIAALFDDPAELARVRNTGYEHTRAFTWPRVGAQYLQLGETLARTGTRTRSRRDLPRASSLPELRLDHLLRLTDDTGIIQHATFSVPARESGYCVDDNARALMVALHAEALSGSADTKRLVSTYLAFLHAAQTPEGRFRNFMTYGRAFTGADGPESDDCTGRALWALGTTAQPLARRGTAPARAADVRARPAPRDRPRSPRNGADDAGADGVPRPSPGGRARRRAAGAARGPAVQAIPPRGDRRLALVRARLDLRQRASAARAVARAHAHAGVRRAETSLESRWIFSRRPASGTIASSWSETRAGTCGEGSAPTPTSSRSTPRRSCLRSAPRTS